MMNACALAKLNATERTRSFYWDRWKTFNAAASVLHAIGDEEYIIWHVRAMMALRYLNRVTG